MPRRKQKPAQYRTLKRHSAGRNYVIPVGKGYERRQARNGMQATLNRQELGAKYFALCESCFWSATVFGNISLACPSCAGEVSMIPLAGDEQYRLKMSGGGLEMSFSRAKTRG
jgi:hypothetical protein